MKSSAKPKMAVCRFTSCGGCQLSLLDCEDELLKLADVVTIASFPEASDVQIRGPYDISFAEGSITTPQERDRVLHLRQQSKLLVSMGACATSGGIQALRNFGSIEALAASSYPQFEYLGPVENSTALSEHVKVDFELRGCPVSKTQILDLIEAILRGRRPNLPTFSVCEQCKQLGQPCLMIGSGSPCLGPITMAGCGAICPQFGRGCFGCFGPKENPNIDALTEALTKLGISEQERARLFSSMNANAPAFRRATEGAKS